MEPVVIEKVWSPWDAGLLPLAVYASLAFLTVGSMLLLAARVGKKLPSAEKATPFECGIYPTGSARFPFPVPFYLFAAFFLIFDVEALYVLAWAVAADPLGWRGWWQISFFLVILLISLFYIWKKGGLEWGPTSPKIPQTPKTRY
jgi:NADH-quinone oxidoreductase subunit A